MKVKSCDLQDQAMKFLCRVIDTMPTSGHKFAAGLVVGHAEHSVADIIEAHADADGCVDTDSLRHMVKHGFDMAGGKATFRVGMDALSAFLRPVDVTITPDDVEEMIRGVEGMYR